MADIDKVFDALRNCITEPKCRDCPWEDCERFECKRTNIPVSLGLDILELLKKQVAVAPTVKINGYGTRFYYCPNCNREFYCHNQWDNYCTNCGQAVKWE